MTRRWPGLRAKIERFALQWVINNYVKDAIEVKRKLACKPPDFNDPMRGRPSDTRGPAAGEAPLRQGSPWGVAVRRRLPSEAGEHGHTLGRGRAC